MPKVVVSVKEKILEALERRTAVGVRYAFAVNNGPSALHWIINDEGIAEGDEMITGSCCCLLLTYVL